MQRIYNSEPENIEFNKYNFMFAVNINTKDFIKNPFYNITAQA